MNTLDNLFHQGGPLFMGILTILLLILLATAVIFAIYISKGKAQDSEGFRHRLTYLKSMGLFTMITGILGQLIGLLMAFGAIGTGRRYFSTNGVWRIEDFLLHNRLWHPYLSILYSDMVHSGSMVP